MTVTLDKSHELKGNGYLLGVGGENESEQLIINIAYDVLLDKWAYIEFEQNGEKNTTERLTIANGQIVYSIPNGLLVAGHTSVQVVFRDASGFVWKSFKRQFLVSDEINATDNYPQSYPDFITEAQRLLDEVTIESDKVDTVLITEEARVVAEAQRAENEATRIATETERETTEQARKTAESARKTAETERQANETARVNAEKTRETNFNAWSGIYSQLNNLSNALKGKASGETVKVDDVSTVEHTAKVRVSGKNLFRPIIDGAQYQVETEILENNIIKTTGKTVNTGGYSQLKLSLKEGTYTLTATVQGNTVETETKNISVWKQQNGGLIVKWEEGKAKTFTITQDMEVWLGLYARCAINETVLWAIQLEEGDTATEYEPYIKPESVTVLVYGTDETTAETFTPNADGTLEILSISPTMTITTDKAVTIEIEYNRDINKVIKSIEEKINALMR